MKSADQTTQPPTRPWWKQGVVWGLIAGPALVVVAGVITTAIAAVGADSLVPVDHVRRSVKIDAQSGSERAHMPAHQARNHAATPTDRP
ncbi:nitrogen fixation protein FixH [Ramlibacter sp.]|uniref:nitrogen fixation protein FixH n=1 Tax=Ramlibacter sp. TaxID=1917967 RepID=UPI002FC9698F